MKDPGELAALLADPSAALTLPREAVPGLLDALAVQEGRARLLRELLTARLAETPTANGNGAPPAPRPDRLLDADETAARIGLGKDWLYRHRKQLPFARQVGRAVRFSEAGLARWLAARPR